MSILRKMWFRVTRFIDQPINIVGVFTLLILIPNVILAYTEPYSLSTIAASILLPGGLYLLLVLITKRPGVMILWMFPLIFLAAFQIVISYLFKNSIIAVDMFTNVFTTNASEAGELLGSIYPSVIIVCVLYIPLLAIAIRNILINGRLEPAQRKMGVITAGVMITLGVVFTGVSNYNNSLFEIKRHIFPVNVCFNIKMAVDRWMLGSNYPHSSKGFKYSATKRFNPEQREIYLLVVGEASRAYSWSMYGYERETNPLLSKRSNLVLFKDMLTQSNTTHKSVPMILSSVSATNYDSIYRHKSVVTLFKEAGFKSCFISNQSANRSLIDYYTLEADTLIEVTTHNGGLGGLVVDYKLDEEIIPHIENLINESNRDLFIVIHTYGSHTSAYKRYPREFAYFEPDFAGSVSLSTRNRVINAYDNSIRYTDYVLSEMISLLERHSEISSAMLYCSDHGEDLMDDRRKRYLHASPTTTYYQLHVPAFTWFSDRYISLFPEKYNATGDNKSVPASTDVLFHTIADIASIKSKYVDLSRSLVSDRWQTRPRLYLNDYEQAVNVLNTGLSDIDINLMKKHNISIDIKEYQTKRY